MFYTWGNSQSPNFPSPHKCRTIQLWNFRVTDLQGKWLLSTAFLTQPCPGPSSYLPRQADDEPAQAAGSVFPGGGGHSPSAWRGAHDGSLWSWLTPQPKTGELLLIRWIPAGSSSPASSEAQYESGLHNQSIVSTRKDGFPAITGTKIFLPPLKTSSLLLTFCLFASECQVPSPPAPGSPPLRPGEGGSQGSSAGGAAPLCGHLQSQATLIHQVVEAIAQCDSGLLLTVLTYTPCVISVRPLAAEWLSLWGSNFSEAF